MSDPAETTPIKGSQRKWLRGRAHALEPLIHVRKDGVSDGLVAAVAEALASHELIKVRLRAPEDKRALAQELGARAGADVVGLIGHVVILYRPHPTDPKIQLPP